MKYTDQQRLEKIYDNATKLHSYIIENNIPCDEYRIHTSNPVGRKNKNGQLYLNRNASFEYSQNPNFDWIGDSMRRIEIAFRWHKPVTISAHRLNFIGILSEKNRDENLIRLQKFITMIQKRWPDVEFMTSDELGDVIARQK